MPLLMGDRSLKEGVSVKLLEQNWRGGRDFGDSDR